MPESRIRAWFELLRLPNVFTAVADVAMGFLITHAAGASAGQWYAFALLAIASCGMYLAGMVLNDVFDVAVDAQERPQRPIPSGRITRSTAARLGWGLLAGGFVAAAAAGVLSQDWRPPLVAAALAGCVVIYDRYAKRGPTGPIFMGGCRTLNVLLGMSLATGSLAQASAGSWVGAHYMIAASIGTYIVGVTWFARTEARQSARLALLGGTLVAVAGLAVPMLLPNYTLITYPRTTWTLLWLAVMAMIGWRMVWAVVDPTPSVVQAAVKQAILSLIVVDAVLTAGIRGLGWGLAVFLLLIPATYLGRWIYST